MLTLRMAHFEGTLRVFVNNVEHLEFLMHKLKNIKVFNMFRGGTIDESAGSPKFDERFDWCI